MAVGLVVIVGATSLVVRLTAPTAESTVERYFAALGAGQAAEALSLVDFSPAGPLLTDAALAEEQWRPRDLTIEGTAELGSDTGEEYVGVDTRYRAGDATVRQSFVLRTTDAGDEPFLLMGPFVRVEVSGAAGRAVTVNGVAVPAGDGDGDALDAFPGAFSATAAGGALLSASTAEGSPSGETGGGLGVRLSFGPPALAPGAESAVQQGVERRLDECALSTVEAPRGCPFAVYIFGQAGTVAWTIAQYPSLRLTLPLRPVTPSVSFTSTTSGRAAYTVTYNDSAGQPTTETGEDEFQVAGTARAEGGGVVVELY